MNQIFQQKIYLVVQGTNCNDIIQVIQNENYNSDVVKEVYPKLDELGVREMFLVRDNQENKNILGIQDPTKIYPKIMTTLDVSSIESAYILYYSVSDQVEVIPVPYLSTTTNVRNTRSMDEVKEIFQGGNAKKYWDRRELSSNLTTNRLGINSLKSKVPTISWKYCKNKIQYEIAGVQNISKNVNVESSSYATFRFDKFLEKILYPTILENIQRGDVISNVRLSNNTNGRELKPIVLVCNFETVKSFLNEVKSKRYVEGKQRVERGSIWEVEMKVQYDTTLSKKEMFQCIQYKKRFPTELNASGTMYQKDSDRFMMKYKSRTIPMTIASEKIAVDTVVGLECKFCKNEGKMRESLKRIYERIPKEEKKEENKKNEKNEKNVNKNKSWSMNSFKDVVSTLIE